MSDSIHIDIRAEAVKAKFAGASKKLHDAVLHAVTGLSIELQALVKRKLTGEVLHVRTGTLRRSINRVVVDHEGQIRAQIGTNVVYAAAHEYGFQGIVQIRAYIRKTYAPGSTVLSKGGRRGIRTWIRKRGEQTGEAHVKSHARKMNIPERSFLRSSLREMAPKISADIRAAALGALK